MGITRQSTASICRNPAAAVAHPASSMSVVLCTRDRPCQLRRALRSLLALQDTPTEIIVIENRSGDSGLKTALAKEFPSVRYTQEPVEGLDIARNRALAAANNNLVVFLDDDAVAHPAWLAGIQQGFASGPQVSLVTGRVEALTLDTVAARLFEANGGYGRGGKKIVLPGSGRPRWLARFVPLIARVINVGNGTNFAVRKDCALAIGGFDEAFDLGAALHGGGDLDFFWRMVTGGYTIAYEPEALVWHEHRSEIDAMSRQLAAHQCALVAFIVKSLSHAAGLRRRLSIFCFLLWRLVKPGLRLLRRTARLDPLPAPILLRMWLAVWRGLTVYSKAQQILAQRNQAASGDTADA